VQTVYFYLIPTNIRDTLFNKTCGDWITDKCNTSNHTHYHIDCNTQLHIDNFNFWLNIDSQTIENLLMRINLFALIIIWINNYIRFMILIWLFHPCGNYIENEKYEKICFSQDNIEQRLNVLHVSYVNVKTNWRKSDNYYFKNALYKK